MPDTPADTLRAAAKLARSSTDLNGSTVTGKALAHWLEAAAENTPYDPNAIIVAAAILDSPPVSIVTGGDCQ